MNCLVIQCLQLNSLRLQVTGEATTAQDSTETSFPVCLIPSVTPSSRVTMGCRCHNNTLLRQKTNGFPRKIGNTGEFANSFTQETSFLSLLSPTRKELNDQYLLYQEPIEHIATEH